MRAVLVIISIIWISLGAILVLYTQQAKEAQKNLISGINVRTLSVGPTLIGLLLLVGAFSIPDVFWLAFLLGILALLKGAFLAFGPIVQIQQAQDWWFNRADETTIRMWGLIAFTVGVALFTRLV